MSNNFYNQLQSTHADSPEIRTCRFPTTPPLLVIRKMYLYNILSDFLTFLLSEWLAEKFTSSLRTAGKIPAPCPKWLHNLARMSTY